MALGANEDQVLDDISTMLWRERRLLELLVFKLEEERLLLSAGKARWVNQASREIEVVLEQLRIAELMRAVQVEAAAADLGLGSFPGLLSLSQVAPEPWSSLLLRHRQAFLELSGEIDDLSEHNRHLLARERDAAREGLVLSEVGAHVGGAEGTDDIGLAVAAASYDAAFETTARVSQPSLAEFLS